LQLEENNYYNNLKDEYVTEKKVVSSGWWVFKNEDV